MTYSLRIEKKAIKEMRILPYDIQDGIKERIKKELTSFPYPNGDNDIKKIIGSKFYRLRTGDYRIFYDIDSDNDVVYILSIRHNPKHIERYNISMLQ